MHSAGLHPLEYGAGFTEGVGRGGRVDGPMHGDDGSGCSDELVKLEEMDVAALAALGGVEHDEQVVGIGVDLGHLVALQAVPDGEWMEAKHLRQRLRGLLIAFGDIDPHEPVLTLEQHLKLLDGTAFNALVGDQPDVHPAHPFPDRVSSP